MSQEIGTDVTRVIDSSSAFSHLAGFHFSRKVFLAKALNDD